MKTIDWIYFRSRMEEINESIVRAFSSMNEQAKQAAKSFDELSKAMSKIKIKDANKEEKRKKLAEKGSK